LQNRIVMLRPIVPWIFVLMYLWIALAVIPLPPQILGTGLDSSWAYALNLAHVDNFVFGKDVVFTFGPLGYLFYPVPDLVAPLPAFGFIWAMYAYFLFGLLLIWRALGHRLIILVSWIILSGAMLFTDLPFERLQLSFLGVAIGIVALLVVEADAHSVYLVVAGVTAGLIPLFKASEGIGACAVYYALLSLLFLIGQDKRRALHKVRMLVLVPPLAFVLGFAIVERNVSSLWDFVTRTTHIVLGYSEAMGEAGPMYQAILAIFGVVTLCVIVPLLAERPGALVLGLLPAALLSFFAFRNGMVRQDPHHVSLLHVKLAVAGLFLLVCSKTARDRLLLVTYVAGSFVLGVSLFVAAFPGQGALPEHRALLQDAAENLSANWHYSATWGRVGAQARKRLEKMRLDAAISGMVGAGTVDDVPNEIDIVAANGWRWCPRPVFQSYSAYMPELDELNARHLASPASADHIIMQWEAIDGRNPLLDDAAAWRALFDHYDVELARPDLLVLQRRDTARNLAPSEASSVTAAWHRDISVPELDPAQFVMMRAEIDKTVWGSLRGILFRNSPIYLTANHVSGKQSRWRVTRANLVDGAFVGRLPENLGETLPYFGQPSDSPSDRVVSIRFETSGQAEFSPAIRISWFSVASRPAEPRSDTPPVVAMASPSSTPPAFGTPERGRRPPASR